MTYLTRRGFLRAMVQECFATITQFSVTEGPNEDRAEIKMAFRLGATSFVKEEGEKKFSQLSYGGILGLARVDITASGGERLEDLIDQVEDTVEDAILTFRTTKVFESTTKKVQFERIDVEDFLPSINREDGKAYLQVPFVVTFRQTRKQQPK